MRVSVRSTQRFCKGEQYRVGVDLSQRSCPRGYALGPSRQTHPAGVDPQGRIFKNGVTISPADAWGERAAKVRQRNAYDRIEI